MNQVLQVCEASLLHFSSKYTHESLTLVRLIYDRKATNIIDEKHDRNFMIR